MKVVMYTDGACKGNPGPGGWGALLQATTDKGLSERELCGGERETTNNRMELMAAIVGLEALKVQPSKVTIYTDSKYVADSVEKGWVFNWVKIRFKGKKNSDLWMRFLEIYSKHQVKFLWVKGHASIPENERCDELAVEASLSPALLKDVGYQPGA